MKRGAYLVTMMGCNDCHTPWKMGAQGPEPDMTRALTGHPADMVLPPPPIAVGPWIWHGAATNTAFAGPWGVSFTANLTPDKETGLGNWTDAQIIASIEQVYGTRVRLVTDVADRDRFGRMLAYVYGPDGAFLNADLVASGRHLVTLFTFCDDRTGAPNDDWLAYHPEGFYDGSPGVERHLAWRVGEAVQTVEKLAAQLHRPDQISSALESTSVRPASP